MNEPLYRAIADRYGFSLPEDYRRLEARGLLQLTAPAHASAFTQPGSYLWLPDMEWLTPQAIADFKFEDYHLPGFVPFACTASGDHWCWQPARTDQHGTPVLCCPHDDYFATVYAPNFAAALYRQTLAVCHETDLDAPAFLRRWAIDLANLLRPEWTARLQELAASPDRSTLASQLEQADFPRDHLDQKTRWMK